MKNKTYWMIERGSPCEWWVGNLRIPNEDGGEWTTDSSKAQHFPEEWMGNHHAAELEKWGIRGPLRATGHLDMPGSPQEIHPAVTSLSAGRGICPFCGAHGFDPLGLKMHLAFQCLPYAETVPK